MRPPNPCCALLVSIGSAGCSQPDDSTTHGNATVHDTAADATSDPEETAGDSAEGVTWTCEAAVPDALQAVRGTRAAPYLVHHPIPDDPQAPTLLFMPGGSGSEGGARRTWEKYLMNGASVDRYRVVVPFSDAGDLIDDSGRMLDVLAEILACYGGDPAHVQVAGHSYGGNMAFGLMYTHSELFSSLLGIPGAFLYGDAPRWAAALGTRPVYNGVGSEDVGWRSLAESTHGALLTEGADSTLVLFPGQDHNFTIPDFNPEGLFAFWDAH